MTARKSKTKGPKLKAKSTPKRKRLSARDKPARFGPLLSKLVYSYMEPGNAAHARAQGKKKKWGSISAYVNALVAKDRGVKAATGTRGQKGFKQKRRFKHNKPRPGESKATRTSKPRSGRKTKVRATTRKAPVRSSKKATHRKTKTRLKVHTPIRKRKLTAVLIRAPKKVHRSSVAAHKVAA